MEKGEREREREKREGNDVKTWSKNENDEIIYGDQGELTYRGRARTFWDDTTGADWSTATADPEMSIVCNRV